MDENHKKRGNIIKTLTDIIFITLCSGIFMLYLYFGNLKEILFGEIAPILLCFSAIGWLLYIVLRLVLKKSRKAAVLSGVAMVFLANAGRLTEALGYTAVLPLGLLAIAAVFFVIIRFVSEDTAGKMEFIVTAVLAALILFNVAVSIPQFAENNRLSEQAAEKAALQEEIKIPEKYAEGDAELPNLYIFVFDELAGTKCMREVFGYDNKVFYDNMRSLGFAVSDDCTNYKQFTMECLSGLFNLDYVFDYDTDGFFACRERFKNARFFSIMNRMGYGMYETEAGGFTDFEPRFKNGASKEYNIDEDGRTTFEIILDWSLFGPVADSLGIFPQNYDLFDEILTYYTLPESYTYKNALTFTYICCPHAPFIYDINGNPVDKANSMNWSDSKYFLEQYEYMCGRIVDAMEGVIQNDKESVILVLSDHGVKPNKSLWNGPSATYEQSVDTFFAVYTGGGDIGDITGLCGADVLRKVLNTRYGFNLDMTAALAG
ncbi:MAG: hypothetical protein WDA65_05360 [Christensenellales bacterium]